MATINNKDFEDLYNHYDGFDSLCYEALCAKPIQRRYRHPKDYPGDAQDAR